MPQIKCIRGFALDPTTTDSQLKPCDIDDAAHRKQAWQKIGNGQPMLIMRSPMCTAISASQELSALRRDPLVVSREYARAMVRFRLHMSVYAHQVRHGRYVLHEHPGHAASGGESVIEKIIELQGVS